MAKVFIGMPAYNGERFIREAIESIINQSYADWILFISDDASTDNTPTICKEYAKKDSRIVYYRQEKNLGIFPSFKFLLDRAESEYFMWAAHDDIREKDYLKVCVEHMEQNTKLGLATTRMAAIDSFGRTLVEELALTRLSGKPGYLNVARYVLQPEILGKCNLMYGLFRLDAARATWQAYPQRHVWGQDYMFSLALISRYEIYVDPQILFKKRLGGISSPRALLDDKKDSVQKLEFKQPKNHMFPFGRFKGYFMGHMEALAGTPYRPLAAVLLFIRLPRAFIIHVKERSFKKAFKRIFAKILLLWQ
ncbi:MAG: glycosyltransferase family 2 protein [Candidatus Sungbacteria bacterium]|nr:glycosyltransferase family 2 protein [Candidatus Sungbacteria bacterium]